MNNSKKRYNAWITGYSGFLGSRLLKNLSNEFNIFQISRNDIIKKNEFITLDKKLSEIKSKEFQNNYLFHLATYYNNNIDDNIKASKAIESNILFGLRIINNFHSNFFNKILLSQSYMELCQDKNINLYSLTKSLFAKELELTLSNKIIKVYLYDTFGLNDKRGKLINTWLKKMVKNENVNIFNETKKINLTSDKFVSEIFSRIKSIDPGNYELRSNVELTLSDLFDLLIELTNSKSQKIVKEGNNMTLPTYYDNLPDIFDLQYNLENFKKDIKEILNKEIY